MTYAKERRYADMLQLATAVGILVLLQEIYSGGALLLFAVVVGVSYIVAAILALRDNLVGIWIASGFSLAAFAFSVWGVYRYIDNGFAWLSGNFPGRTGFYWPAYLFLAIAAGSFAVIVLRAMALRARRATPRSGSSESTSR